MSRDDPREWVTMGDNGFIWPKLPPPVPIDELARQQGVVPFQPGEDVGLDLWDSEEEFQEFLANVRACRQADLG